MNKALLSQTLEKVKNLPPEDVCEFTAESAGVLAAFLEARKKLPSISNAEQALHSKITRLLEAWQSAEPPPDPPNGDAKERRTQLALREAIDKIEQEKWDALEPDEVRLVTATHEALSKRGEDRGEREKRLSELLGRVVEKYKKYVATKAKAEDSGNGSPSVFGGGDPEQPAPPPKVKNEVLADRDLRGGQLTPLALVEQIEADLNVRTFTFEGETSVAGDVHKDVLIQVDEGGITVDGFVAGNIVASGDVTVHGNVQGGLLISKRGRISVGRCLIGSRLIATGGDVVCKHVEAPERIFAWGKVQVDGPVLGGDIRAKSIHTKGNVMSANLHACGEISVGSLDTGGRGPTVTCLRETLTCEDYDRAIDAANGEKKQRVHQLENDIREAEERDGITNQLIYNCYKTALFYLLGGVASATNAMQVQGLHIRSAHLNQLISLAQGVSRYCLSITNQTAAAGPDEAVRFFLDALESLGTIHKEMEAMPTDFGTVHRRFLLDRCAELQARVRALREAFTENEHEEYIHKTFNPRVSEWREALSECDRQIQDIVTKFSLGEKILERIENEPESLESMVEDTVVEYLDSTNHEERQRAKSPLVRLLKEYAERYKKTVQRSREVVVAARHELKELRTALAEDAVVLYGEPTAGACRVTAKKFGKGAILTVTPGERDGFDSNVGKVIVLTAGIDTETTFYLQDSLIQRQV